MADIDLAWRVEETFLNARPSPVEVKLEGWLVRAAGGATRRTNSVNPTRCRSADTDSVIIEAERIYRRLDRPPIFRIPTIAAEMEDGLARRGYRHQAETRVLLAEDFAVPNTAADIDITPAPTEAWMAAWSGMGETAAPLRPESFRRMADCIVQPKAFAGVSAEGRLVSIAYGVVHRGLLAIESVATHPEHRQRGHGRRVIAALMRWAADDGGRSACLSVLADNDPALALYRSLGFRRELYRYHYRRDDRPAAI